MPAVCKFYVQGYCRYGDSCRFEHPSGGSGFAYSAQRQLFGGGGGGGGGGSRGGRGGGNQYNVTFRDSFGTSGNQNQYRWTSTDFQKQQQGQKQTTVQVSPNDVINSLINEIREWEQSNMWPFSCIAFEKDGPCVPDFDDKSPEELRMEAYDAIKTGNIPNYEFQVQKLTTDYNNKRQMLKNPGMQLKQKLLSLIEDYRIKKNSRTGSSFGNSGVSLFSSSSNAPFTSGTQKNSDIFGSSSSSGSSPLSNAQNIFGSASNFCSSETGASNIFGGPQAGSSGVFGTSSSLLGALQTAASNPFGTAQTGASSPSGTAQTGTANPFGTTQTSSPVGLFGKPAKGSTSAFGTSPATTSGPFGSTQSGAFGSSTPFSSTPVAGAGSSFGNTSSGFGSVNQTGAFGVTSGNASTSTPSVNLFGTTTQGLFSGSEVANSPMGKSGQSSFGTSGASSSSSVAPSTGLFGKPAQPSQSHSSAASSVYTPLDSLTPDELAAFQAPTFTLGKIPTKPPPRELCF